jgi:signal transduction histidine kinase
MAAWVVLLITYAAGCAAALLLWRRPPPTPSRDTVWDRISDSLRGRRRALLLPFVLAFSGGISGPSLMFLLMLLAVVTVLVRPALAVRLLPVMLLILGAIGFQRAAKLPFSWPGLQWYGVLPVNGSSLGTMAVLIQAWAFTGLGLWLLARSGGSWSPLARRLAMRPVRSGQASSRPPWNLLLIPVVAVIMLELATSAAPGRRVVLVFALLAGLVTLALVRYAPAAAADLAVAGLVGTGIFGVLVAFRWTHGHGGFGQTSYGITVVTNGPLAVLAALQGLAILGFGLWLVPRAVDTRTLDLLWPRAAADAKLAGRVEQLTQTRADAVDTAETELRRVERDLHDGAQARLVALGMSLRAAEKLIPDSPQAAQSLIAEAIQTSSKALTELRDLVRGILPPVLADRGLADAVRALALDTPLHTETDIDLPGRPDAPIESACYFAVAEALTNAVKHSGARHVQIRMRHSGGLLRIEVTDDGTGGADPAAGTGLAGLERRLGTFDGILAVSSPPGGPTLIVIEVPCALSSPKISSS